MNTGLKSLTRFNSHHVRLAKGGKEYVPDTSKPVRKYMTELERTAFKKKGK